MYQFRISAATRDDMNLAFKWYNNQQAVVGNELIREVFITFHAIEQNPFLYAEKFSGKFRFAIVNRFPFFIVYEVFERTIIINSVFHTSRNPSPYERS